MSSTSPLAAEIKLHEKVFCQNLSEWARNSNKNPRLEFYLRPLKDALLETLAQKTVHLETLDRMIENQDSLKDLKTNDVKPSFRLSLARLIDKLRKAQSPSAGTQQNVSFEAELSLLSQFLRQHQALQALERLRTADTFTVDLTKTNYQTLAPSFATLTAAAQDLLLEEGATRVNFDADLKRALIRIDDDFHLVGNTDIALQEQELDTLSAQFTQGFDPKIFGNIQQAHGAHVGQFILDNYKLANESFGQPNFIIQNKTAMSRIKNEAFIEIANIVYGVSVPSDPSRNYMIYQGRRIDVDVSDMVNLTEGLERSEYDQHLRSLGFSPIYSYHIQAGLALDKKSLDTARIKVAVESDKPELLQYVGPNPSAPNKVKIQLSEPRARFIKDQAKRLEDFRLEMEQTLDKELRRLSDKRLQVHLNPKLLSKRENLMYALIEIKALKTRFPEYQVQAKGYELLAVCTTLKNTFHRSLFKRVLQRLIEKLKSLIGVAPKIRIKSVVSLKANAVLQNFKNEHHLFFRFDPKTKDEKPKQEPAPDSRLVTHIKPDAPMPPRPF